MAPRAAFVSFRFGDTDGVSVVARTWIDAFAGFGFDVVTVTGSPTTFGDVPSRVVAGLGIDDRRETGGIADDLDAQLADVDLVVVENLLTIPLNLAASAAVAEVLAGRPAILHHHDPPWHRERFAHITALPARDPAWRHVAITHLLDGELAERGIDSTVIYNAFPEPEVRDAAGRSQLRAEVRAAIGLGDEELVVAHPVRAIDRKNVPAAIELATALDATYWLLGPAEEGFGDELARLIDAARCRVVHRPWHEVDGIYAAADHVTFPSTWEGFGNPPIEAALRRRTVSVGDYAVASELRALGFDWFGPHDVDGIRAALSPDPPAAVTAALDANERLALERFSLPRLHAELRSLLDEAGWLP